MNEQRFPAGWDEQRVQRLLAELDVQTDKEWTPGREIDMSATLQELGIDRLSIEERLTLAQELWDSVAADLERQPLTPAQRAELERRVAAADANPAEGVPWEV